jgi:very-short-patch-repair endonuclease
MFKVAPRVLPSSRAKRGGEGSGVGGRAVERVPRQRDKRVLRARKLRHEMTDAERKLWWHLRRIPIEGTHFRRQATIGPYFADFACHEKRVVVEVDGGQHNQPSHIPADAKRTEDLKSRGYRVLRFWNHEVLKNIEGVMESIYAAVREAGPPPLTPPRRASRGRRGAERPRPAVKSAPLAGNVANTIGKARP